MSDIVRFRLSCIPPKTTHHAKRIVRVGTFSRLADTPELVKAKATLDALLIPYQIAAPIAPPVVLSVVFTFPWRENEKKRDRLKGRIPHTSRPDCSNLVKTLEDRLQALRFITDDNGVAELRVQKWWGDDPGIEIMLQPFGERLIVRPRDTADDLFSAAARQEARV